MTKSQIFKSQFPNFKGALNFFTFDDEQLNFIDVVSDTVEFTITKRKAMQTPIHPPLQVLTRASFQMSKHFSYV